MGAHVSIPEKIHLASRSALARLSSAYSVNEVESGEKERKKKSLSKFATLKKKFIRNRRHSRFHDHAKTMREMLSTWPVEDIKILVQEYEVSAALKELSFAATIARPTVHSLRYDLSCLYDSKFCTDVTLIFKNYCFPVHRAILSARCPYFKKLLAQHPEYGARVHIKLKTSGVDVTLFSSLLKYLYSGDLIEESLTNKDLLNQLAREFGVPNVLEYDMKALLDTGEFSDAVLIFSMDSDVNDTLSCHHNSESCHCMTQSVHASVRTSRFEFPCHRAIIASRSPFFRNLINRRAKSGEELTERTLRMPSRIILDESVIPRRYARVLLTALYQDTIDMGCVLRGSPSLCSLSEIQAMVSTGRCQMTVVDEAMELYQIGQFLDTQIISQGCEDIIIESLTSDSLVNVLNWSAEPHGSKWVYRQAMAFLTEEFTQIAQSPVLYDISKEYLMEALSSDVLQASEQDVLSCVIKWGEHQLYKRTEEREPNLLSHTTHSITKKGLKKKDINDAELLDLVSDILPLVRIDHVLPSNNDILNNAIKRGLVVPPISFSHRDDLVLHTIGAWTGVARCGIFQKPRLFLPYYEEAKNILEELLQQDHNSYNKVRAIHLSTIPDTLYMLEENDVSLSLPISVSPSAAVDVIAGSVPVPDRVTFVSMLKREQELLQSKSAQHALMLASIDKRAVTKNVTLNIQLRVVREFGLPDSAVEVLQNSQYYYSDCICKCSDIHHSFTQSRLADQQWQCIRCFQNKKFSTLRVKDLDKNNHLESTLSDTIPDIAMPRSSPQAQVSDKAFQLDISIGCRERGSTIYI